MFKVHQVITSNTLRKRFGDICRELEGQPQAVLVLQRRGAKLVLVNAEIFQDLLDFRFGSVGAKRDEESLEDYFSDSCRVP